MTNPILQHHYHAYSHAPHSAGGVHIPHFQGTLNEVLDWLEAQGPSARLHYYLNPGPARTAIQPPL